MNINIKVQCNKLLSIIKIIILWSEHKNGWKLLIIAINKTLVILVSNSERKLQVWLTIIDTKEKANDDGIKNWENVTNNAVSKT